MIIIDIAFTLLYTYFFCYVLYFLFYSLAGNSIAYGQLDFGANATKGKFLVLIPAYKEDQIIKITATQAIAHNYPSELFETVVIADKLQTSTVGFLREKNIQVVEVDFEESTKAKSINYALNVLPSTYDYVMILDSDNMMADDCLDYINDAFQKGYKAVQGHRTAKNKNTSFAVLDGISEEINNHIFRIGHRAVGLSSALIGSGMAFEYHYYKQMMMGNEAMGGEDREAELRIFKDNVTIAYVGNATIYDEKVQQAAVFAKQRTRWIAGQFYFFKKHGKEGIKQLLKGNIDFFNKMLQTLIPPRAIMLGSIPLLAIASYFLPLSISSWQWSMLLILFALALFTAIPRRLIDFNLLKSLTQIPVAIIYMVKGMLKIGVAHKTNFHTPHTTEDVEKR